VSGNFGDYTFPRSTIIANMAKILLAIMTICQNFKHRNLAEVFYVGSISAYTQIDERSRLSAELSVQPDLGLCRKTNSVEVAACSIDILAHLGVIYM
jgi:hypothetical protein